MRTMSSLTRVGRYTFLTMLGAGASVSPPIGLYAALQLAGTARDERSHRMP